LGAFLLISENSKGFNTESALGVMKLQCGTEPARFNLGNWELYIFPKLLLPWQKNYRIKEDLALFVTGTPYIQGYSYIASLDILIGNIQIGKNTDKVKGHFFALIKNSKELKFMTDESGIYSIYHLSDGTVLSSSFLALAEGLPVLNINTAAFLENILTGSIIGNETIFCEIKRFEPSIPFDFPGLNFIKPSNTSYESVHFKDRTQSIKAQIEALDNCFKGLRNLADDYGIDSGITGGYDSRLLMAMCIRHFDSMKIQFHSHKRLNPDVDFIKGKELCKITGINFVESPVRFISESAVKDIKKFMDEAMLFTDGQVRTHLFWHEDYNTAFYRINTLVDKKLGIGGIGGEQYRNQERLLPEMSLGLENWIRNRLIINYCGAETLKNKILNDIVKHISDKLIRRIPFKKKGRIDLSEIKYYMQEIFIPANRGLRSSFENRLSMFLYPFTDPEVESFARLAVPFLGLRLDYEAEMIRMINPELAAVKSTYGYDFLGKEPLTKLWAQFIFVNFRNRFWDRILSALLTSGRTEKWIEMKDRISYLGETTEVVRSLNFPISIENLLRRTDTGPLVFAFGHLFMRYSDKLKVG